MAGNRIENVKLFDSGQIIDAATVVFHDGKISKIIADGKLTYSSTSTYVDGGGNYLVPGFIDLHIHGLHHYLIDNGPEDLAGMCRELPRYGVTGFLPTVAPRPKGSDAEFLALLAKTKTEGTQILGFHLEGPFLTITGALPPEALGQADSKRVRALIEAAEPYRAIFSISPDFEGIDQLLPIMTANGTPAFITHTRADVKQTQTAIKLGARHATHFYDVFYPPPESDPGVRPCGAVEAILADKSVSVDFILDGVHVDPAAVKTALCCKGPEKVCLISDANIGAGCAAGRYRFGEEEIEIAYLGAPARMVKNHGLAGSGLTLDRALRNAMNLLGVNLPQAVDMVSANPAGVLGLAHRKGRIAVDYDADLVLLDDTYNVVQTWVGGECVYEKAT